MAEQRGMVSGEHLMKQSPPIGCTEEETHDAVAARLGLNRDERDRVCALYEGAVPAGNEASTQPGEQPHGQLLNV